MQALAARKLRRNGLPIVIASKSRIGRIRRAVCREFILSAGNPILARYPRVKRFQDWQRWSVRWALIEEAVVICSESLRSRPYFDRLSQATDFPDKSLLALVTADKKETTHHSQKPPLGSFSY